MPLCKNVDCKGQKKSKWFFKPTFPPKKTNEFYFTTMKPQVDLFSFVFLEEIIFLWILLTGDKSVYGLR